LAVVAVACEGGTPPGGEPHPIRAALEITRLSEPFDGVAPFLTPYAGGTWQEVGGILQLRSPGASSHNGNIILADYGFTTDFTVTTRARALAGAGWNDFSVIFAWETPDRYYFASFNEGNDTETNGIFRWRDGQLQEVADFPALTAPDVWHDIRIERHGQTVRVYRDGELMGAATDPTLGRGVVGLGSRNDSCDFDYLIGTEPDVPEGVVLTQPTGNSFANGLRGVSASAQGAVGVQFFRTLADGSGTPIAPEDTVAPFISDFDTMMLGNGAETLFARARYADGQTLESDRVRVLLANDCIRFGATQSQSIRAFSNDFEANWDGLPDGTGMDAGFLLSLGPASYFSQGAAIVRFSPSGLIEARDGDHYAAVQPLAYQPGHTTHFHMTVDPPTRTYSVVARQANGPEVPIASGFAFRPENSVGTIDHWTGIQDPESGGPLEICNVRAFH
jgi:hypothetical protein